MTDTLEEIRSYHEELTAIRRDIHAHPEMGLEETRTAALVAGKLREWGIEVTEGVGQTGVVGTVRGRLPGQRSIGLRADMDALSIPEQTGLPYASQNPGVMHACGHDGHTTMLLGAARYLAGHRDFSGTVHLIFQPAEEGRAGAKAMIDDGLFEKFPCDAVFGMHNWPGYAVGQFGTTPGPMMASASKFEITVTGKGAHAAMPHLGIDPIFVAVQIAQGLQGILTRNKRPLDAAVLSITLIKGGDTYNVVPDTAVIWGTVRTFTDAVTDLIEERMRHISEMTAAAHGATASVWFNRYYPPLANHAAETEFAASVARDIVGAANVEHPCEPTLGSEDFSFMLQVRPGCYVFIGNGDGAHRAGGHGLGPCALHNPSFDFNDELIPLGATYWIRLVERYLGR